MTSDSSATTLVIDEWATTDGSSTAVLDSPGVSLTYSINGGGDLSDKIIANLKNHQNATFGDISSNNGSISFGGIALSTGQTFTVKAGAYTFDGSANFNAATIGTFTGSIFLANNSGTRISDIVVVPEPSTYASIMGGCLLGAGALRRMRHTTKLPTDSLS